jgi:hypothetical protein
VVVTSDAARAIESGRLLAPGREIPASPLLRELDLPPPQLRGLRLPLAGWALTYGFRWIYNRVTKRPDHAMEELARASQAAEWLAGLAEPSGTVVAVTHATFRHHVARELSARGWRPIPGRRRSHPWSAWRLTLTPNPGRCPGLKEGGPLGLKSAVGASGLKARPSSDRGNALG